MTNQTNPNPPDAKPLGTRCEAQQRVLSSGLGRGFKSWRDVDAEIKRVEQEIVEDRKGGKHDR